MSRLDASRGPGSGSRPAPPSAFEIWTQEKQDAWLDGLQAKIARGLTGDNAWMGKEPSPLRAEVTPPLNEERMEPEDDGEESLFGAHSDAEEENDDVDDGGDDDMVNGFGACAYRARTR